MRHLYNAQKWKILKLPGSELNRLEDMEHHEYGDANDNRGENDDSYGEVD